MSAPVDVLAVMDLYTAELTAAVQRLVREVASGRVSNYDRELSDLDKWWTDALNARTAVEELIKADEEYDATNLALQTLDAADFASDEDCDAAYDSLCAKFDAVRDRRAAALAACGVAK